jgi:predicted dehydrogenase
VSGLRALDDATAVVIEHHGGSVSTLGTSFFTTDTVRLGAYGTDGAAWSEGDGARFYRQERTAPDRVEESVAPLDTIADEVAEFVACVRSGEAPETGLAEGLEVSAVLEAIVASGTTGCGVDVDRFTGR